MGPVMTRPDRYAELERIAEFDHPFRVTAVGTVEDAPSGIYAPDVYHVEGQRTPRDIEIHGDGWEALTGYTGQYSYNGVVMHASEYLGGGLASDILEAPGVYVVCAVEVMPDECSCGAYPDTGTCAFCGGITDRREAGAMQGIWYYCRGECRPTLVIDGCECDDDPEPAGWAVLRLTGGPGNGDDGTECPRWDDTRGARCGDLMAPVGVGVSPIGEPGTRWQCVRCGPASEVLVIREISSRNA